MLDCLAEQRVRLVASCLEAWSEAASQRRSQRLIGVTMGRNAAHRRLTEAYTAWSMWKRTRSNLRASLQIYQERCGLVPPYVVNNKLQENSGWCLLKEISCTDIP